MWFCMEMAARSLKIWCLSFKVFQPSNTATEYSAVEGLFRANKVDDVCSLELGQQHRKPSTFEYIMLATTIT